MTTAITNAFLDQVIAGLKQKILNFETAVTALESGAVTEYNLDTGQTVVKVKKADVSNLRESLRTMYGRLSELDIRRHGGSTTQMIPDY